MKQSALFFLILFSTFCSFSQNTFFLNASDNVNASIQTLDGNFIVSGGLYGVDVPVYKITVTGQTIWSKTLSIQNAGDGIYSTGNNIINTSDGGFAISGTYKNNLVLCKFTGNGNIEWSKEYIHYPGSSGSKVVQTDDGGYLLATTVFVHKNPNVNPDSSRCFLVKTNAAGNVQWSKQYFTNVLSQVTDLKKAKDSGYIFTTINSKDQSLNGDTSYIVKINDEGNVLWSEYVHNLSGLIYAHGVLSTSNSGYLVVGHTFGIPNTGGFITKINKSGNTEWSKTTLTGTSDFTAVEANNNSYIVAGGGSGTVGQQYYYFTEIDKSGLQQWSKVIKDDDAVGADIDIFSLMKTNDNGYLATGVHAKHVIIKFDSAFNSCEAEDKLDGLNNFTDFIPGTNIVTNGSLIDTSVSILVSNEGTLSNICGALSVKLLNFTAQKQNNTTLLQWQTANEINNSHFNIERSPDSKLFTSIGNKQATNNALRNNYVFTDNALLKGINYYRLKQVGKDGKFTYSDIVSVDFSSNAVAFNISPNPAKDYINVVASDNITNAQVSITDMNGRTLYTGKQNFTANQQVKIPAAQFAKQVLMITINTGNGKQEFKVVKE